MFDYKQRPASDEYRENWERIWGLKTEGAYMFSGNLDAINAYINAACPDPIHEDQRTHQADGSPA